jgi:hypothetical protein
MDPKNEKYPQTGPYLSPSTGRRLRPIPDIIQHYYVPLAVLKATSQVMRRYGQEQRECYVWWGGYFSTDHTAQVVTVLYPAVDTDFGRVHLRLKELLVLHAALRDLDQVLLAELHTHPPGVGGQNRVDAAYPAAPYPGFISIVVPDFAFPRLYDLRKTYVYEYRAAGRWRRLTRAQIATRFVIEEESREATIPL